MYMYSVILRQKGSTVYSTIWLAGLSKDVFFFNFQDLNSLNHHGTLTRNIHSRREISSVTKRSARIPKRKRISWESLLV